MSFVTVNIAALEAAASKIEHFSDDMVKVSNEADRLMKAVVRPAVDAVSTKTTDGFIEHMKEYCTTIQEYATILFSYAREMRYAASKYQTVEAENAALIS